MPTIRSTRQPDAAEVSDEEETFVSPYLLLLPEDGLQRRYVLRELLTGIGHTVKTGALKPDFASPGALAIGLPADAPPDGDRQVHRDLG